MSKLEQFDLRGLDQTTPHDVLSPNQSPFLRNARLYAKDDETRRVAIRTRKGAGHYSVPVGETEAITQTSTTGAADQDLNTVHWSAQDFTTVGGGRLTRVDLRLKNADAAIGNLMVQIHEDDGGEPGAMIAHSSVEGTDITDTYAYVTFRFIDAPLLGATTKYWIVGHLQEGGHNNYSWSSTTNTTTGLFTDNSGATWSALSASMNFKTYLSTDGGVKGVTRYYPTNANNETIFAHGTVLYSVNDVGGAVSSLATGFDAGATDYYFDFADDKTYFVNGVDVPKVYDGSTVASVSGSPGVSSLLAAHKNRLFFASVTDPTKVIFSDLGDYSTYGATNFVFVPAPKVSDPIVRLIPFQDSLVIFTRNSKYILAGTDLATFTLRQSTGKRGAINPKAIDVDENYIYFMSDDGFYRFNGSQDEYLSERVQPEIDGIASKDDVEVRCWQNQVRIYYAAPGSPSNDRCLIWEKVYREWFLDTDTFFGHSVVLFKDDNQLVEASDRVGAVYYAEQDFNNLGKPIDFQYWTKYHSFGNSAAKKQIRRFYPLLRAQEAPYEIDLQIDKDLLNKPVSNLLDTQGTGPIWGQFEWGDGTEWGSTSLINPRLTIPGSAVYFQLRFIQDGADTPVEILGYIMYYRIKRPK